MWKTARGFRIRDALGLPLLELALVLTQNKAFERK
jgi:hypothetical protein